MTSATPLVEIVGVTKQYPAETPLRIERLVVSAGDGLVLEGFDVGAAELLIHLVTGASVADEGQVRIAGRDTREIATDTEWLQSLDLFGLVTDRAVLIGPLTVASNLALPLTLAIDPMTAETRARVDALAAEVELTAAALAGPANQLSTPDRMRLHLARALAVGPQVLLLEHPTAAFDGADARAAFGATVRRIAAARRLAWVALSNDEVFARATAGRRLVLQSTTGRLAARSFWQRWRS